MRGMAGPPIVVLRGVQLTLGGAPLFTGVFDNTDVFFKLGQLALGGAR